MKMFQFFFNVKMVKENDMLRVILINFEKCFLLIYDIIDYKVIDFELKQIVLVDFLKVFFFYYCVCYMLIFFKINVIEKYFLFVYEMINDKVIDFELKLIVLIFVQFF